jgi:integrase
MGVFKAKGTPYFQYRFTVGGTPYRGSTQLDKRADAEAWVADQRRKIKLGIEDEKTLTLGEAYAKYELEHLQFKTSYKSIQYKINHVIAYFGEDTWLHGIGQNECEKYLAHCKTEVLRKMAYSPKLKKMVPTKKIYKAKPATINRRLATLQSIILKAKTSWRVTVQDIDFVPLFQKEQTIINNPLPVNAQQTIWDALPNHGKHFVMLSLCLGWRSTNVLTANGSEQIILNAPIPFMWTIGKGGKRIETPITAPLMHYILANNLHETGLICDFWGTGVPIKSIKTAWRTAFKNTGLKYIRPHDLRHTFGSMLYYNTRDQRAVQEGLAHSDIKTSMRYTHTDLSMLHEQMNKMPITIKPLRVAK